MSLGSVFLTSSAFFRWKAYNEIVKETFLVLAALQVIERYNSLQSGSVDERTTVSVQRFLTASVAMPPSLFPFLTAVNLIVSPSSEFDGHESFRKNAGTWIDTRSLIEASDFTRLGVLLQRSLQARDLHSPRGEAAFSRQHLADPWMQASVKLLSCSVLTCITDCCK